MRIAAYIALSLLLIAACVGGFTYFAAQEAVGPDRLKPAAVLELPQFKRPNRSRQSFKIVSYNIGYASGRKNNQGHVLSAQEVEANLAEMVRVLRDLNADVVCLQEVDFKARRSFGANQLEILASQLQMPYVAYVVTWNKNYLAWPYWPPRRHFGSIVSGQAVLSRYPILSQDLLHFAKPAANPFWYNWFYVDRIAQRLTLAVSDRQIEVWNVHLEAFDERSREEQLTVLGKVLEREQGAHVIVAGDYNTPDLQAFAQQAALEMPVSATVTKTYPSWDPHDSIDHILYAGFRLESAGLESGITASDHLPVWAVFAD